MFTGIIQHLGKVVQVRGGASGQVLQIDLGDLADRVRVSGSVAVNGACLTATSIAGRVATFDVMPETVQRTNLGRLRGGDMVNVELPLRTGDPVDGHFVLGHVDGPATIQRIIAGEQQQVIWCSVPDELAGYLIPKGCVALDGVSLTIVQVQASSFSVALIPTTLKATTLGLRKVGEVVNVEADYLAKIIIRHLDRRETASDKSLLEKLQSGGFME